MDRWYALHTMSRHEKKVEKSLREMGYEIYLPIVMKKRRWKDRKKEVPFPLFPGYLFVRMDFDKEGAGEKRRELIRSHGVASMVGSRDPEQPPVPVRDSEIDSIRTVLEKKMKVDPYRYTLRLGQRVRIKAGPLAGVEGVVVDRQGARRLILHVELIQRAVAVEIQPEDVQV